MKTIFHLSILLFAAALICAGAFLAFNQNSAALPAAAGSPEMYPLSSHFEKGSLPDRPEFDAEHRGGHGEEGFSSAEWVGLLLTLAKLGGITLLVLGAQKVFYLLTRKPAAA